MNLDRHHRRIRLKTQVLHWSLWPLTLLAVPLAIYLGYGVCDDADSTAAFAACGAFQALPFLPTFAAAAIAALIAWDLADLGMDLHFERHGARPRRRRLAHAAHGFDAIDERHRRHVRWALVHALALTIALAAWIAYQAYVSTH
jgi:hypothetical protein